MPELSKADAIRSAFLESIRTVILVDDDFPPYGTLGTASRAAIVDPAAISDPTTPPDVSDETGSPETGHEFAAEEPNPTPPSGEAGGEAGQQTADSSPTDAPVRRRADFERAHALWDACRARGFACDIDDGSGIGDQTPGHIEKCDLVILDYHLQSEDPLPALRLLHRLASSEHASLVVVYTRDPNLPMVQLRVSAFLRGARRPEDVLNGGELDKWYETEGWEAEDIAEAVDEQVLGEFLRNTGPWRVHKGLRAALTARGVDPKIQNKFIEASLEQYLITAFKSRTGDAGPAAVEMSTPGRSPLWLKAGNLFVAFVQKSTDASDEGRAVFQALEDALNDWSPHYLPLVLAYARGAVARGGYRLEVESLRDPLLQVGWLYHALSGAPNEKSERIRGLWSRLLSSLMRGVLDDVAGFGERTLPGSSDANASLLDQARQLAPPVPPAVGPIIHSLNEFLACEELGDYVRPGTIFVRSDRALDDNVAWICTTPDCDLVPREPSVAWLRGLHPLRPVVSVRAEIVNCSDQILREAEHGRHVFLTIDGTRKAVWVVDPTSREPKPEQFLLGDMGRIDEGRAFTAYAVVQAASNEPIFQRVQMRAIGQLRNVYASRLLQQAGQHLSRIGVDFVRLPPAP